MVTTEEMWAWRYKDNVRITDSEGESYIGSVIEILEEEEAFGEDLLVLQIGEKKIKTFRKEEIKNIETYN